MLFDRSHRRMWPFRERPPPPSPPPPSSGLSYVVTQQRGARSARTVVEAVKNSGACVPPLPLFLIRLHPPPPPRDRVPLFVRPHQVRPVA